MDLLDVGFFIIKYTPFWAVPLILMSLHFAYIYWLKDYREIAYFCGAITSFCLTSLLVYLLMGGPDRIVNTLAHLIN